MNISKRIFKLVLASLVFSVVQGPVLAMDTWSDVARETSANSRIKAAEAAEAAANTAKEAANELVVGNSAENKAAVKGAKKIVDRFFEWRIAQPLKALKYFTYNGINGVYEIGEKIVFSITPENDLHKLYGVATIVIVGLGTGVLTWYLRDKWGVKHVLGAFKKAVTYKKTLAGIGLASLVIGACYEDPDDWKTHLTVASVIGGIGLVCVFGKRLLDFGLSKFNSGSFKFWNNNTDPKAGYRKFLTILTQVKNSKKIQGDTGAKMKAIFAKKNSDPFLAGLEDDKNKFFSAIQVYKKAKNTENAQKIADLFEVLNTKLQTKLAE